MLSGACDKLFFVCFTIPVSLIIIVLYFFNKDWKLLTKFLVTLAIGTTLAIVVWILFKNNPYFSLTKPYGDITSAYIQDSWLVFSQQMYGYLTTPSFIFVLTYLSILSYIATVIYIFRKTCKLVKKKKDVNTMFAFELFVLFFVPIVFVTPILSGSYDNVASLRYNYFPYLLLPFNLVILASNYLNNNKLLRIVANVVLSFLITGYLLVHFPVQEFGKGLKHFFNFYPERAKIMDDCFLDNTTFKYGVTDDYWLARQATMFSKKKIRLYCVFAGGDPWLHAANKYWFTDNDKGKHAHCEFTFFVWSKEKEIPNFFQTENQVIHSIDLDKWNLYQVAPYRYITPGIRFKVEPVLILPQ
jgi:hypothetical protein